MTSIHQLIFFFSGFKTSSFFYTSGHILLSILITEFIKFVMIYHGHSNFLTVIFLMPEYEQLIQIIQR